jgi:hypothetical protein
MGGCESLTRAIPGFWNCQENITVSGLYKMMLQKKTRHVFLVFSRNPSAKNDMGFVIGTPSWCD